MKAFIGTGALSLALLLAGCGSEGGDKNATGGTASSAPVATIPAPNGGDWTQTVSATADGGFVMGNPNAPVKLVEFASLTCHVCKEFAEQGEPQLIDKYVKTGQVSFEIRNFVRDPADLGAALLSRCNGPAAYFKLTDQLFASQDEWLGKLQTMSPADQQRLQGLQPQQQVGALAQQAGLVDFVRVRGVPAQKAQACLADEQALQKLVDMNSQASQRFQVQGTPTFVINGTTVENAANWAALEPQIQKALGG
jgi:protein-disulfide isomerase